MENTQGNPVPVSTRVKQLEDAVKTMSGDLDSVAVFSKQTGDTASDLKKQLMTASKLIQDLSVKLTVCESKLKRMEQVFDNLDRIMEDTQIRHVALVRVLMNKEEVTDKALDKETASIKEAVLKEQLDVLVRQEVLKPSEIVDRDSTIVFKEIKDDGEVTMSRAQYTFAALETTLGSEIATMFLDKKVGESVKTSSDSDRNLIVTEIYKLKS